MRYEARQWNENDLVPHMVGRWGVFGSDGECIFGSNLPRDEHEAKQCARAANLAALAVTAKLREQMRKLLDNYGYRS